MFSGRGRFELCGEWYFQDKNIFKKIWIQPASGDAGGAIGAVLGTYYLMHNKKRVVSKSDSMNGSYLGPKYSDQQIESSLKIK